MRGDLIMFEFIKTWAWLVLIIVFGLLAVVGLIIDKKEIDNY
jgi:hypothetical protein